MASLRRQQEDSVPVSVSILPVVLQLLGLRVSFACGHFGITWTIAFMLISFRFGRSLNLVAFKLI